MDCGGATDKLNLLLNQGKTLDLLLGSGGVEEITEKQLDLEKTSDEFFDAWQRHDKEFMGWLGEDTAWRDIQDEINSLDFQEYCRDMSEGMYKAMKMIKEYLRLRLLSFDEQLHPIIYKKFLYELDASPELQERIDLLDFRFLPIGYLFKQLIHSAFLDEYANDHETPFLIPKTIPQKYKLDFGIMLERANVEIDDTIGGVECLYGMSGGRVKAKEIVNGVATRMTGGIIEIGKCRLGTVAGKATGGTLVIDENLSTIGDSETTGVTYYLKHNLGSIQSGDGCTIFVDDRMGEPISTNEKGLMLKRNYSPECEIVKVDGERRLNDMSFVGYFYDEQNDEFMRSGDSKVPIILAGWRARMLSFSIYPQKNSEWMPAPLKNGFLLVKDAKEFGFSNDEGGIIIIDDPSLSLEAAREKVAKAKDRKGGVILYLQKTVEKGRFGMGKKRKAEFIRIG